MKILVAEDDPVSRRLVRALLTKWGHDVVVVRDGSEAWEALQGPDAPQLAVLDWMMPEMDGTDVCRKVREGPDPRRVYIILLTARGNRENIVEGLQAGANDYVTKPFFPEELRARIQVGEETVRLQSSLADRVRELEDALSHVKQLQGLLPICSYCKKVRDDQNYWHQVESYVSEHSEAQFSHSICPECYEKIVLPELERMESRNAPA